MSLFNLSISATYSSITDEQLDTLVISKQNDYPNWGNRQMFGYLISQNIGDSWVRNLRVIDPEGSIMRIYIGFSTCGVDPIRWLDLTIYGIMMGITS